MITSLEVGTQIPRDSNYSDAKMARNFWKLSYEGGENYRKGNDATGKPILVPHRREEEAGYAAGQSGNRQTNYRDRLERAVLSNHLKPTIDKSIAYVFKGRITRDDQPDDYTDFLRNFNGSFTPVDKFMKATLKEALIYGTTYVLCWAKSDIEEITTVQQAKLYLRFEVDQICPNQVIYQDSEDGIINQAILDLGSDQYLYVDDQQYICFEGKDGNISSITWQETHGFSQTPLISFTVDTLTGNLAEQQKAIFNYESYLNEETANCTFSQQYFIGVDGSSLKEDKSISVGSDRILILPPLPGMTQTAGVLGADPMQADSLRKTISAAKADFYRIAGFPSPDPLNTNAPESGIAKAFNLVELEGRLASYAAECERVERLITNFWMATTGVTIDKEVAYPSEYGVSDVDDLLDRVTQILALDVPNIMKRKQIEEYQKASGSYSSEEAQEQEAVLLLKYADETTITATDTSARSDVSTEDEQSTKQMIADTQLRNNAQVRE